ncbi:undecaprenyldiphospho-muramoylpentapeptide beta-N- acetylglucosaminyltransferase [bacterium BMS3Bbin14]|nr:undecaprenyldiphospho-muramoylpentapeptide beta-N- acetylglucosaminyltransferase [bacterium BMS3Abin13]GBE52566.1 undecaprenyldiphospho-muramoylpentapeptide beta-N- acetylglucosaminyltransferase [bacterium BMS3Bbin14]HDL98049.1 glycosyltransferase [Desulfobacteraceae bacterium]
MGEHELYNILMYSHDTYGLGHIRRTLAIAGYLRSASTNILILTGSPVAGRFRFPDNVDFVRIPGMIKKTNDEYQALAIRIDPEHAVTIRKAIISATAATFRPDLFIVDKEPLGLKREVLPVLQWFRRHSPQTRTILGLRDIMDDRATVRRDWRRRNVYHYLEELYSEIWVYGRQEIYDPAVEYDIPAAVRDKMFFTGYLQRPVASAKRSLKTRQKFAVRDQDRLIVLTAGGGGDGFKMMDTYLAMHESRPVPGIKSILITGPFMPREQRGLLAQRARPYRITVLPFYPRMEEMFGAADLVITMGGYNTVCEILSQQTPALIIPRETPRLEQLLRAEALKKQRLIEFIPWSALNPERLHHQLLAMLDDLQPYRQAIAGFPLDGIDFIKNRLRHFKGSRP